MSLEVNFKSFCAGSLPKAEFIKKNYEETYSKIFDLAYYLPKTDISKIEIKDHQVIMTFRRNRMNLLCEVDEFRTAPIETLNFLKYEEEEVSVFKQLLCGKKLFYDIGGNIGFYAVYAAMENPDLFVETFEPMPKMFSTLVKNIEINCLNERVHANNFGFSDSQGLVNFYIYPYGGTNASMKNVSNSDEAREVSAQVLRLDDFLKDKKQAPDIIKCDVEGAEKLVLMGGLETIRQNRPVIFFEILRKWSAKFNYHPNDILKALRELGYDCFVPNQGKLKPFTAVDDNTVETNFFFLHRDTHKIHIQDLVVA
jgi:FkbM family methyltransferase